MLLVIAQATVPFEPHHRPGNPGWPEPAASSSGPCNPYSYQLPGTQKGWCGSPASTALPVGVVLPATAQLLLPVWSSLPAASEPPGTIACSAPSGVR